MNNNVRIQRYAFLIGAVAIELGKPKAGLVVKGNPRMAFAPQYLSSNAKVQGMFTTRAVRCRNRDWLEVLGTGGVDAWNHTPLALPLEFGHIGPTDTVEVVFDYSGIIPPLDAEVTLYSASYSVRGSVEP